MPSLENKFRLLKLNQRVSESAAFVTRTVWQENAGDAYEVEELEGATCYMGLDLSETTDLTAGVLVFEPAEEDGPLPVICQFWVPGDDLRGRVHRDKVPYDVWAKEGFVDTKSSRTVSYGRVADWIVWALRTFDVRAVGFDRYRMDRLRKRLVDKGYEWSDDDGFLMPIGQGFVSQTRSIEVLEDLLLHRRLAHGGHPVLQWCAANTVVVRDPAGNRKFDKSKSYGRIDGTVALALAVHARDNLYGGDAVGSIFSDPSVAICM
jgi:phage terminase large subunit-like protein